MSICTSTDCTSQNDRFKLFAISIGLILFGISAISFLPEKPKQFNLLGAEAPYYSFEPLTYLEKERKIKSEELTWKYSLKDTCYYWPKSEPELCDPNARAPRLVEGTLNP